MIVPFGADRGASCPFGFIEPVAAKVELRCKAQCLSVVRAPFERAGDLSARCAGGAGSVQ